MNLQPGKQFRQRQHESRKNIPAGKYAILIDKDGGLGPGIDCGGTSPGVDVPDNLHTGLEALTQLLIHLGFRVAL